MMDYVIINLMENKHNKERVTESIITKLEIKKLKGIKDLTMTFEKRLTCLIGENGIGKSTILHALACVYKQKSKGKKAAHKLSEFFTPYSGQDWSDSSFFVDIRETTTEGRILQTNGINYKKSDRWAPRNARKRERDTVYIGLSTCVPAIEAENSRSMIDMQRVDNSQNKLINDDIKKHLGVIMSKQYAEVFEFKHKNKEYIGISEPDASGAIKTYSSLSMSAGEQRCIQILRDVLNAQYNSLILIEEIDVLLHQDALIKLVGELSKIAEQKKHQIIFSCHNPIIEKADNIDFRCLQKNGNAGLICYDGFLHYNLLPLTGEKNTRQRIYVEDKLSKSIIDHILSKYKILKSVDVLCIGSCSNAFSLVGGLYTSRILGTDDYFVVLDGDEYRADDEKLKMLNKCRNGSETEKENRVLIKNIIEYNMPLDDRTGEYKKPERYIKETILNCPDIQDDSEFLGEIINSKYNPNHHEEVQQVFNLLGMDHESGYKQLVQYFAKTKEFEAFIEPVIKVLKLRNLIE